MNEIIITVLSLATQDEVISKVKDIGGKFVTVEPHLTDPAKYYLRCESVAFLCWVCNVLGRFDININSEDSN